MSKGDLCKTTLVIVRGGGALIVRCEWRGIHRTVTGLPIWVTRTQRKGRALHQKTFDADHAVREFPNDKRGRADGRRHLASWMDWT